MGLLPATPGEALTWVRRSLANEFRVARDAARLGPL